MNLRAPPSPTPTSSSSPSSLPESLRRLEAAAKAWERDVVIPHCAVCSRPCCALTDVVLELSGAEAETLYRITSSTKELPPTVQRQGDRFFAHGAPCPAFATGTHKCTIYDTGRKPVACADFPVYADADVVTADRRCEAVAANLIGLEDALVAVLGDGESLVVLSDPDHSEVFVSFAIEGPAGAEAPPTTPTAPAQAAKAQMAPPASSPPPARPTPKPAAKDREPRPTQPQVVPAKDREPRPKQPQVVPAKEREPRPKAPPRPAPKSEGRTPDAPARDRAPGPPPPPWRGTPKPAATDGHGAPRPTSPRGPDRGTPDRGVPGGRAPDRGTPDRGPPHGPPRGHKR